MENLITLAIMTAFIVIFLTLSVFRTINAQYASVNKTIITEETTSAAVPVIVTNELININTATVEELMTLNGIGEVTAQKIIEYRDKNNGFLYIDELLEVDGIGEAKLDKIRDFITIG